MHKIKAEPKQPTQVPKRNNRNSFTARVGRKKKNGNNRNKLQFENEDVVDELQNNNERNITDNNRKIENDFLE